MEGLIFGILRYFSVLSYSYLQLLKTSGFKLYVTEMKRNEIKENRTCLDFHVSDSVTGQRSYL